MKVGPCMSACARIVRPEGLEHFLARQRGGKRQRPAGQRLADSQDIGGDAGRLKREQRAGAAEAGEYLVEDEENVVAVGGLAQRAQHLRRRESACRPRLAPAVQQ